MLHLVGEMGLEPTRSEDQRILSPLRLPLRHSPILQGSFMFIGFEPTKKFFTEIFIIQVRIAV